MRLSVNLLIAELFVSLGLMIGSSCEERRPTLLMRHTALVIKLHGLVGKSGLGHRIMPLKLRKSLLVQLGLTQPQSIKVSLLVY